MLTACFPPNERVRVAQCHFEGVSAGGRSYAVTMPEEIWDFVFTINRWLHVVATALLLGGALFLKFVVPRAISDLKEEQQLAVFGRARWVFRRIVWLCTAVLLFSGCLSFLRVWPIYRQQLAATGSSWLTSLPWGAAHVALGLLAFGVLLWVTRGRKLVQRPVGWLGVTLVVLLVAVFVASAARHLELDMGHWTDSVRTARHAK